MPAYYNEIDPYCVQWLCNLIDAGHIPFGVVDSRPIQEVKGDDLNGYDQCHFFAGIGGWALALKLAGWGDRPAWTGSCPCQPFSVAGKQRGFGDERDLWPVFANLIRERSPSVVFGEQVASSAPWIARMRSDLETMDYAVGAMPIQAACAGAPQYRDRIWFVASGGSAGREWREGAEDRPGYGGENARWIESNGGIADGGEDGSLPSNDFQRESDGGLQRSRQLGGTSGEPENSISELASESSIPERESQHREQSQSWEDSRSDGSGVSAGHCENGNVASEHLPRLERLKSQPINDGTQRVPVERSPVSRLVRDPSLGWGEGWTEPEFRSRGFTAAVASLPDGTQFIGCPDGKYRRLPPPRVRWLGNGIPSRVARLRAFGNAIVPSVAAEFIGAYLDTIAISPVI